MPIYSEIPARACVNDHKGEPVYDADGNYYGCRLLMGGARKATKKTRKAAKKTKKHRKATRKARK